MQLEVQVCLLGGGLVSIRARRVWFRGEYYGCARWRLAWRWRRWRGAGRRRNRRRRRSSRS